MLLVLSFTGEVSMSEDGERFVETWLEAYVSSDNASKFVISAIGDELPSAVYGGSAGIIRDFISVADPHRFPPQVFFDGSIEVMIDDVHGILFEFMGVKYKTRGYIAVCRSVGEAECVEFIDGQVVRSYRSHGRDIMTIVLDWQIMKAKDFKVVYPICYVGGF